MAALLASASAAAPAPNTLLPAWEGMRFYVHEEFGKAFEDVSPEILKLTPLDEHLPVFTAEYLIDIYLIEALRGHPGRLESEPDPDDASVLHVLPVPVFSSCVLSSLKKDGGDSHAERMMTLMDLDKYSSFHAGIPYLIIAASCTRCQVISEGACQQFFPHELDLLLSRAKEKNLILGVTDKEFPDWRRDFTYHRFTSSVVLPYRTHYMVKDTPSSEDDAPRDIDILFHGSLKRRDGGLRQIMVDAVNQLNTTYSVSLQTPEIAQHGNPWDKQVRTSRRQLRVRTGTKELSGWLSRRGSWFRRLPRWPSTRSQPCSARSSASCQTATPRRRAACLTQWRRDVCR